MYNRYTVGLFGVAFSNAVEIDARKRKLTSAAMSTSLSHTDMLTYTNKVHRCRSF
jgi:hypothetical protein